MTLFDAQQSLAKGYHQEGMETMVATPLDWSQCANVERIPGKVGGALLFKNTRTPVFIVFENLEAGMSIDDITEQYPVTREQINTVLSFVAKSVAPPLQRL